MTEIVAVTGCTPVGRSGGGVAAVGDAEAGDTALEAPFEDGTGGGDGAFRLGGGGGGAGAGAPFDMEPGSGGAGGEGAEAGAGLDLQPGSGGAGGRGAAEAGAPLDLQPGSGGAGGGGAEPGAPLDPEPGSADGIRGAQGAASGAGGAATGALAVRVWVAGNRAISGVAVDNAAGDIGAAGSASGSASKLVPIVIGTVDGVTAVDAGQPLGSVDVSAMKPSLEM